MAGENIEISKERYTFEFPGSLQGFLPCEYNHGCMSKVSVHNKNENSNENALVISCECVADGVTANVATQTFIDFSKIALNFSTVASPTLYSSQIVRTKASIETDQEVFLTPYILYYDIDNQSRVIYGEPHKLEKQRKEFEWKVPDTKGMCIYKLGYQITSAKRFKGNVLIYSIDWDGAPSEFAQRGMLMNSIWNTNPLWLAGFASSAAQFAADFNQTYCVSHQENNGLVTIGTKEWKDYKVESTIYFNLHKSGGLVVRSVGHKRYYGAVLMNYNTAQIFVQKDKNRKILTETEFIYVEDKPYKLQFAAHGRELSFWVNGEEILCASDNTYTCGGAGFTISKGTMTCDSFIVLGE